MKVEHMLAGLYWSAARRYELWQDARWEKRHAVSTAQITYINEMELVSENAEHGVEHDPSPVFHTERILDALPVSGTETLVDFGSGRGRMVLLAARRFQEVLGVEFALELARASEKNIANYRGKLRCKPRIFAKDATDFIIPQDKELVLWFYAPFRPPVMSKVLDNVSNSYRRNPRKICVVYSNPFHRELMDNIDWLKEQPLPIRGSLFKYRLSHVFYTSKEYSEQVATTTSSN